MRQQPRLEEREQGGDDSNRRQFSGLPSTAGALLDWVSKVQPGSMLYEMEGVTEEVAREAFRLAAAKLPVKTTFVSRTVI